jgi:tetratricopeptide (TPR) repeat protein
MSSAGSDYNAVQEAMRYVPRMIQRDRRNVVKEIRLQLSAWKNRLGTLPPWHPPEALSTLPPGLQATSPASYLERMEFDEEDCDFLFQSSNMQKASDWIVNSPYRDPLFADWLESRKSGMGPEEYLQLENAMKLFDWVIRNVWADGQAKDIETLPANPSNTAVELGPGYGQLPWKTMMFARGEPIGRARVFSQLAFQQSIPVSWIALPKSGAQELQLWALGVPVGKQIFLFEPRMGIPLPGPNQIGVATLEEARRDPTVLRRARLTDLFGYGVAAADIQKPVLLLDIEPMALSQRMRLLEKDLPAEQRLTLAADADGWLKQFRDLAPEAEVRLWNVPWLAYQYSKELNEKLQMFTPFSMQYIQTNGLFVDDTPVTRARQLHHSGLLADTFDQEGAWNAYMELQVDDATLARLPYDQSVQKQLMVERFPQEELPEFQARVQMFQGLYRRAKLETALFLSMSKFDIGDYAQALDFADKRMLRKSGTDAWHPMCWYLMARSLEQMGEHAQADELYRRSPSAQEAGNRIRARLLRARVEAAGKPS